MMAPLPPAGRRVVGRALVASAALMLTVAALVWLRAVPIAGEARPLLSGLLLLIGVVEGLVGLRFLGES